MVEIGAGGSTPSVIRWPVESLVRGVPGARLVRINRDRAEVPDDLEALAVRADVPEVPAGGQGSTADAIARRAIREPA